ncbi:MAG: FAD-dependent oxidoreductase [Hyphomicrobiaceae bacterium]
MNTRDDLDCDLLVVGSGAAGLATAVTAAYLGLDVIVIEKESQIGGTTAWSGGWMWVPRNPLAVAAGLVEDIAAPREYLRNELGDRYQSDLVEMFLGQAPRMVSFFSKNTALQFIDGNVIPDFHSENIGGAKGGRSVCAAPFDGRRLGQRIKDLKPPLPEFAPFGMGIAAGAELRHFLNVTRKVGSFAYVAKRLARHWRDVSRHGRGMHLVAGNALVASLYKSALDLGVRVLLGTPALELMTEQGHVNGAHVGSARKARAIRSWRGVVLACGGFPHSTARIAALFPHAPTGSEHHSAAPKGNTGDGLCLGEFVGGEVRHDLTDAGAWAPVSLVPRADGTTGRFPHLIERAKPGLIAVRRNGRRFSNEANSYHDMMGDLFRALEQGEPAEAWLICDHKFQRRYGLGAARPRPFPLRDMLANGYLRCGRTIAELALACGIDPSALVATVDAYNGPARIGHDPEFGRGSTAYNRMQGDAERQPNPCVAPIEAVPFYAVKVVAGSLGTFAGLRTDAHARVLDSRHQPIGGLYAVGNDMSSMMGGSYPAGGITLGPAMTFGYVAAHHACGIPLDNNRTTTEETVP